MTNETKKPSSGRSPVSVRLTHEERELLEVAVRGTPLSRYIRLRLFQVDGKDTISADEERLSPAACQRLLGQILSSLGNSGMAATLSELAELTRLGLLPDDAETVTSLAQARDELAKLRNDLLQAIGLRPKSEGRK